PSVAAIAALAAALGLDAPVVEQPTAAGGGWTVGDPSLPQLTVTADPQGTWWFSAADRVPCAAAPPGHVSAPTPIPIPAASAARGAPPTAPVVPPTTPCVVASGGPSAEVAQERARSVLRASGQDPATYQLGVDATEGATWVEARLLLDGIEAPVTVGMS